MQTIQDLVQWFDKEGLNASTMQNTKRMEELTIASKLVTEFLQESLKDNQE